MQAIKRAGLPVRAVLHANGLYLALRQIAPEELEDAFLAQTIARIPAADEYVRIAREELGQVAPDTAPSGLIFHVARCGSTLLSQTLKKFDNVVVYSERVR